MPSIFHNPAAMAPFFDDVIVVEGVRPGGRSVKGTFNACVFDLGLADIDQDALATSGEHAFSIQIRKCEWTEPSPPWRGMTVRRANRRINATLKIVSVDEDDMSFILRCESKGAADAHS